jgi:hypothetical protein
VFTVDLYKGGAMPKDIDIHFTALEELKEHVLREVNRFSSVFVLESRRAPPTTLANINRLGSFIELLGGLRRLADATGRAMAESRPGVEELYLEAVVAVATFSKLDVRQYRSRKLRGLILRYIRKDKDLQDSRDLIEL